MCDTVVVVGPESVLFAKNSDRDPTEPQLLEWQPRRSHPPGARVRCTHVEIPQARETNAVLLSRPFWMWGAEIGANEHGVVIGNEAVFIREPYAKEGLTGMDLLRLALERAASAKAAVEVIVELLERHGQGGGCGFEHPSFTYHNSFIAADAREAWVLETAGKRYATERVAGARSISNALTIAGFDERADRLKTWASCSRQRRTRTEELARSARSPADMMRILRDHGAGRVWPEYGWATGAMKAPCMHAGGLVASAQTTASWVAELRPQRTRHWVTGTSAPCVGLFKPVDVAEPVDTGPPPAAAPDPQSLWWRGERLHRRVMRDPARYGALFLRERDEVEREWIAAPPPSREAFDRAGGLLADWTRRVESAPERDARPL
ncbi:MAG: C69 family dipeptidase, partial [Candidatus Binatia bacterium]